MSAKADKFYLHWETCCNGCQLDGLGFCSEGRELLYEAVTELPEPWQRIHRWLLTKERLKREAAENVEYYKESDEDEPFRDFFDPGIPKPGM